MILRNILLVLVGDTVVADDADADGVDETAAGVSLLAKNMKKRQTTKDKG